MTGSGVIAHIRAQHGPTLTALTDPETLEAVVTACEQRLGLAPAAAPAAPECPEGWQPCTPDYVAKHGDCAAAPRVSFRGDVRSHYHPIRDVAAPAVIVYKGIPTTIDALASGVESLVPAGVPVLEPAP